MQKIVCGGCVLLIYMVPICYHATTTASIFNIFSRFQHIKCVCERKFQWYHQVDLNAGYSAPYSCHSYLFTTDLVQLYALSVLKTGMHGQNMPVYEVNNTFINKLCGFASTSNCYLWNALCLKLQGTIIYEKISIYSSWYQYLHTTQRPQS